MSHLSQYNIIACTAAHLITRIDETVKAYSLHFDTLMGMLRDEEAGEDALSYLIYRYERSLSFCVVGNCVSTEVANKFKRFFTSAKLELGCLGMC